MKRRLPQRLALVLASLGAFMPACHEASAQTGQPTACGELSDAKSAEIERFVQKKYRLPFLPTVKLDNVEEDCYRKLRFGSSDPRRAFNLGLFLSPDQTRLFPATFDVRVDPEAAERRESEKRRDLVLKGAKAVAGPEQPAVAVVLYSDFQCPYCAQLWTTLKDFRALLPGSVTLYHRSFPLDNLHPWAHKAEVLASCAHAQNRAYFLAVADSLFAEQPKVSAAGVGEIALARLRSAPGFDEQAYSRCLSSGAGEREVNDDIASALAAGVDAVPTIFVNGVKIKGVTTTEHLMTVVRQALASTTMTQNKSN